MRTAKKIKVNNISRDGIIRYALVRGLLLRRYSTMVYWKWNIAAAILDEASRSKNEENSKALAITADSCNRIVFVDR